MVGPTRAERARHISTILLWSGDIASKPAVMRLRWRVNRTTTLPVARISQYANPERANILSGFVDGQMGNSEVGHLNLGAGRIVRLDITRIDHAIETGEFFQDTTLLKAMHHASEGMHALHLDRSQKAMVECTRPSAAPLCAALRMAAQHKLERVFVHAFMDGREHASDLQALGIPKSCIRSSLSTESASWPA